MELHHQAAKKRSLKCDFIFTRALSGERVLAVIRDTRSYQRSDSGELELYSLDRRMTIARLKIPGTNLSNDIKVAGSKIFIVSSSGVTSYDYLSGQVAHLPMSNAQSIEIQNGKIDISRLMEGNYIINVASDEKIFRSRFIVLFHFNINGK